MTKTNPYVALVVMAVVTYLIRVVPIALIKGKLKSRFLKSFLYYMPYAVLGAMTFPAILFSTGNVVASALGGAFALFLAYHNQEMIKVAIGGIVVAYICQLWLGF